MSRQLPLPPLQLPRLRDSSLSEEDTSWRQKGQESWAAMNREGERH